MSLLRAAGSVVMPRSAVLFAPPLAETAFLVDAAARAIGRLSQIIFFNDTATTQIYTFFSPSVSLS
mgnify:CR=1 FL=1